MVSVLLFARAGDIAKTKIHKTNPGSVADLIAELSITYGEEMSELLKVSRVWINGDPTTADQRYEETDEVAVIPPVSGG